MEDRNYTDEQIKQDVAKTLENPLLRKCSQCANRNRDCTRCEHLGIPITRFMYAGHCKFYLTDEEKLLAEAKEAIAKKDLENKKDDRLLTMSFTSVEMSIVFLEHFESRIEEEFNKAVKRIESKYKGTQKRMTEEDEQYLKDHRREHKRLSDYVASLKGALKKMDFHLKEARKQFTHMVEPKLNKAFFDKDFSSFKGDEYDNHSEDVFEMCLVNLKYFDSTYMSNTHGKSVIDFIDSLPADRVMQAEDYKRYKFRK